MDLWLFALIALALIPVVRVFMAAGCRRGEAPGTNPLAVTVSANGEIPNSSPPARANVRIIRGHVDVASPRGRREFDWDFEGTLHAHDFAVTPDMFGGRTEPPYDWSASCWVDYECPDGPLPGAGRIAGAHNFQWDANHHGQLLFTLHLIDRGHDTGTVEPGPFVHAYEWELDGGFA
jgi:hypothetical protein